MKAHECGCVACAQLRAAAQLDDDDLPPVLGERYRDTRLDIERAANQENYP